jgi:LmbE family N-acetylglucosaminyl deacetylase
MHFYNQVLRCISSEYLEKDLAKSAVVFSPHFDDEILGCGGIIIKKERAGSDLKIVFMTDGSKSHSHLIAEDELKTIRASEALAASQSLGLTKDDIFFLDFEEGKLSEYKDSATNKATKILLSQQPDEIFVPYRREPQLWSSDHLTTNKIVMSALKMYRRQVTIYEYPIWFWYNQLWVGAGTDSAKRALSSSILSLISGLNLLKDFRCSIYIGDVLHLKRSALDQYRSQMTRLIADPRWQTLGDVSNGEFLKCFFQEYEIFSRTLFNG